MINIDNQSLLHQQLQTEGVATIQDAFDSAFMERLNRYIDHLTQSNGMKYQSAVGWKSMEGSGLDELGQSDALKAVMSSICEADNLPVKPTENVFQVLRVLAGATGVDQSHLYHFDAYYLTLAVPIRIPKSEAGPNGDLILYPKTRPIRKFAVTNMAEKAVYQSGFARKLVRNGKFPGLPTPVRLSMEPGNAYLFYGYQTLHGNDVCEVDQVRATALFHFGSLHSDSQLVSYIEKRRTKDLVKSESTA